MGRAVMGTMMDETEYGPKGTAVLEPSFRNDAQSKPHGRRSVRPVIGSCERTVHLMRPWHPSSSF